jgi:hypothetical protein
MKNIIIFTILFIFLSCNNYDYKRFKELEQEMKIGDSFESIALLIRKSNFKFSINEIKDENIKIAIYGPVMSSEEIELTFECKGNLIDKISYH